MVTHPASESKALFFSQSLRRRAREIGSWLCVGIDPQIEHMPAGLPRTAEGIVEFCSTVIRATEHLAACYKLNFAFFEAMGPDGWRALSDVRRTVPGHIPVIADAKRGDIGSTSAAYARAIFDVLGFDAATVNPYLGWDALEPFTHRAGKGVLIVCRTSNAGSGTFQLLESNGEPLYLRVARDALALDGPAEVGLVMGATHPDSMQRVRSLSEDVLLLVPGVGSQGADASRTIRAGANLRGENAIISISRQILYAPDGPDYAEAACRAAERFVNEMRGYLWEP